MCSAPYDQQMYLKKMVPAQCMISSEFHLEREATSINLRVRNAPSLTGKK